MVNGGNWVPDTRGASPPGRLKHERILNTGLRMRSGGACHTGAIERTATGFIEAPLTNNREPTMIKFTALTAALLATTIGFGTVAAPVAAEAGQVTFHIRPHGKDARALRTGLAIFSLIQGAQNRAKVQQNGDNNAAGIAQNGSGNGALLVQDGSGHTGTITQNGNNNNCGLFQFGKNTSGGCSQTGNGGLDLVLQGGW